MRLSTCLISRCDVDVSARFEDLLHCLVLDPAGLPSGDRDDGCPQTGVVGVEPGHTRETRSDPILLSPKEHGVLNQIVDRVLGQLAT
jgi:hypothetical protein